MDMNLAIPLNPRNPGDYTGSDGLLRCGVCGQPKRKRVDISPDKDGSVMKIASVACDCVKRHRAKAVAQSAEAKLVRMQERGGISAHCTFQAAEQSPELDKCRRYAANWDKAKAANVGLLLWGDVGTGKTFAAHCVCNELLRRPEPVGAFVTSLSRVLNSGWDKSGIAERVRNAPLVVFDDLGAERSSEYALENVFMLVDERYRARKPLIVTTNLTIGEISNPVAKDPKTGQMFPDMRRKRIYDRILEVCVPIRFKGASRREAIGAGKLDFAVGVLGLAEGGVSNGE